MTSTDLLHWTRKRNPVLEPEHAYDAAGVFTGCFASSHTADDRLSVVYTSIRKLPFHWNTPPYPRNAAGLAIATSSDGGKTWEKAQVNPILPGEPDDVEVTGFRDPFMATWPAVAKLLDRPKDLIFGLVSGGIEGAGPTTFLYEIEPTDITKWKYSGSLIDIPLNFQPSKNWSGNYGANWECVNFLSLPHASTFKHFLVVCVEGDVERAHVKSYNLPTSLPPRTVRAQLWMSGDLVKKDSSIKFQYRHGGYLDHGSYYAANSFLDPASGRHVLHGWIPEEDITIECARRKGWNGSLAIPREVFLLTIPAAVHALKSPLSEISCVETEARSDGSFDLHTLGVRPISEMEHLRSTCRRHHRIETPLPLPLSASEQRHWLCSTTSSAWELEATISLTANCETIGFHILHDDDLSFSTTITFSAIAETITVDRVSSNDADDINKCAEAGPFTLFTTAQSRGHGDGEVELIQEPLHMLIFSDGDVLEVFANDRFALATMVYSRTRNGGIRSFATGETDSAVFDSVNIWENLNDGLSLFVDEVDG